MHTAAGWSDPTGAFQSAPGREAGRCRSLLIAVLGQKGFNPRPAGRPGDAMVVPYTCVEDTVSIRARPGGRAMPVSGSLLVVTVVFQSAPGREAGRCVGVLVNTTFLFQFQSAPGREAGRCSARPMSPSGFSKFQSAPGREAGRCAFATRDRAIELMFQSAPGREAGRCRYLVDILTRHTGFNPRPAGRPGDASSTSHRKDNLPSFNPRPAGRPGDAIHGRCASLLRPVSIRARPGGRAMLHSLNVQFRLRIYT